MSLRRAGVESILDVAADPRMSMTKTIRFATSNDDKLAEAQDLLLSAGLTVEGIPQDILHQVIEPQSTSLKTIATSKLDQMLSILGEGGVPIFVEDAGLFIEVWNGFPGPFSSFVHTTLGCAGVLALMRGLSDRRAHFEAVIAIRLYGRTHLLEGRIDGSISQRIDGDDGFGFDPIFIPEGESSTFARLGGAFKRRSSHRTEALENLLHLLQHAD